MESPLKLSGIGLRAPHYGDILAKKPELAWVEIHSENYFVDNHHTISLEKIRTHYPVSLHGVCMSIGSADDINWQHLASLKQLCERIDPCLVSDHLSWSSIDGRYLHDLLPLPYTEEALKHVSDKISQIQDYLQRQILLENISTYVRFNHSTLPEVEFINAVADAAGCGILLDINNLYLNATNLGFNPIHYLNALNPLHIQELHLAGFSTMMIEDREILIDSHNQPIVPAVWDLYRIAIQRFGIKPTIIEWDKDLPSLESLCLEAYRAEKIQRDIYVTRSTT